MTERLRLETMAEARRFNALLFRRVAPFIGARVLEVGMGIGTFTERLLRRCRSVVGVDVVPEFLAGARERFRDARHLEILAADMGAGIPPALAGRRFDSVVCINVLEHIADDERALAAFFDLLEPGGTLVLLVPQYPWLFNPLDAHDGHHRRYRRRELGAKLARTGFDLLKLGAFNLAGIVGWFVNGTLLRRHDLPQGQMRLYDAVAPVLLGLERLVGPPAGLSVLAVARRPTGVTSSRTPARGTAA